MFDSLLSGDHAFGNGVAQQRPAPRYVNAALQLTRLWRQSPAQQAGEHAGWEQCRCLSDAQLSAAQKNYLNYAEQLSNTI